MSQSDIESILSVIGALVVLLTVIAHLPYVRGSKAGNFLLKLTAVDIVGVLRVIALVLTKKPEPPKTPSED